MSILAAMLVLAGKTVCNVCIVGLASALCVKYGAHDTDTTTTTPVPRPLVVLASYEKLLAFHVVQTTFWLGQVPCLRPVTLVFRYFPFCLVLWRWWMCLACYGLCVLCGVWSLCYFYWLDYVASIVASMALTMWCSWFELCVCLCLPL
jgi:hypothetical protein